MSLPVLIVKLWNEFFIDFEGSIVFFDLMNVGLLDGFIFEDDFVELLFEVVFFLIVNNFIVDDNIAHLGHGDFLEFFIK